MDALAAAAEASALGSFARGSSWAYPIANLGHLLGLVLLVGGIGVIDLRLIGAFRSLPLVALARVLTPLALAGLALMAMTGPILFAADATALGRIHSVPLEARLDRCWRSSMRLPSAGFGRGTIASRGRSFARWQAASIGLWLTVAALGRLIAYF